MDFDTFWHHMRRARTAADRGLVIFRRVPSSHAVARRAAREYQAEGNRPPALDFLAWEQSAGRGRQERSWSSPAGAGIYASMVRSLPSDGARALPLTVPTALATALAEDAGVECEVKWPNDLTVGDKKLAGILIDVVTGSEQDPVAVISFGVNHGDPALFDEPRAISTTGMGSSIGLDELAARLMERVDRELERVAGVADVLSTYRRLSAHHPGDELECRLEDGSGGTTRGVFLGIDDHGLLRLRVAGEERRLSSGRLVEA